MATKSGDSSVPGNAGASGASTGGSHKTFGQRFEKAIESPVSPRESAPAAAEVIEPVVPTTPPTAPLPRAQTAADDGWGGETIVAWLLYAFAVLLGLLGIVGGLYSLSDAALRGLQPQDWLRVSAWILLGLAAAGSLTGLGLLLSLVGQRGRQIRQIGRQVVELADRVGRPGQVAGGGSSAESVGAASAGDAVSQRLAERMGRLEAAVGQIAHDCLLDDAGRAARRQQVAAQQRDTAVERIHQEMLTGQWDRVRESLARFRASHPADQEQATRLTEEFDRRCQQAEAEDVAEVRRQCDELLSVSAWDRAVEAASALVQKHPESTTAKSLLTRIDRERKVAQEQLRQSVYAQIQRHTSRREWSEAVSAAHRLIAQFPNSIEAEAVKAQMDTLLSNAEIQIRQGMEGSIKDLVKRQRYQDAVALADELVGKYPGSPQAAVLRATLPQMRQKADEAARQAGGRRGQ